MNPILIGTLLFVLATTVGVIVVAQTTARYLEPPPDAATAASKAPGFEVTSPGESAAGASPAGDHGTADDSADDTASLVAHHDDIRHAIDRHRRLLVIVIASLFCIIVMMATGRVVAAVLGIVADNQKLTDWSRDSKFWLVTFGVGTFVQAFAVTMLYSLQSFYRQSMQSFEVLSTVHRVKIAVKLLDGLVVDGPAALHRDLARIDVIAALVPRSDGRQDGHGQPGEAKP